MGRSISCIIGNTVAARYILCLGANTKLCVANARTFTSTGEPDLRRYHHLRNLFWIAYQQDKDLCLRTGQPPALSEYNCDLELPFNYEEDYKLSLNLETCPRPVFPGDLRLGQFKSKAYIDLYSLRALEKSDAMVLQNIRQLDGDLERWRMTIPTEYRPTLYFSPTTTHDLRKVNARSVMLRLEYHNCMAYIHQACGRFRPKASPHHDHLQGLSSSLMLSISACRASLSYLLVVKRALCPTDFWLMLFYPLSAILTIFCHVIMNPGLPETRKDLDLISRIAGLIRELGQDDDQMNERLYHSERIWHFVMSLVNIARRRVDREASDVV
ncbi:hypothetical protein BO78DRAFT_425625 [Aspergillus sclerotiicarbonarius CBS 121057]|uniref:Xylanolytic transcriptional activator regulatory domain-containing protein n=1 Tax=Aspergillus sclerotiicarbonarius (strain CBS 121057 / IBT 28362) TaxID=1448318 RepID=A0A319EPY7_ASPSB|nr:hypothetical protein BO78DRAFT_425625 [Aspergillus sclerotiicarbonarius CBS 121057]